MLTVLKGWRVKTHGFTIQKNLGDADFISVLFCYNLGNTFLIKQKHRNDRVVSNCSHKKIWTPKPDFGYDFAGIFIFVRLKMYTLTTLKSKPLPFPSNLPVLKHQLRHHRMMKTGPNDVVWALGELSFNFLSVSQVLSKVFLKYIGSTLEIRDQEGRDN